MKVLIALLSLTAFASVTPAADQTGAEKTKKPVSAKVIVPKDTPKDADQTGNVEVTYADGTKDRWTTKGNAGMAHVAKDGTVGWVIYEPPQQAKTASYAVRYRREIVLCRQGKIIQHLKSERGFIDAWEFGADGKTIAVASMGLHGPELYQLFDRETGKELKSAKSEDGPAPKWAKGVEQE